MSSPLRNSNKENAPAGPPASAGAPAAAKAKPKGPPAYMLNVGYRFIRKQRDKQRQLILDEVITLRNVLQKEQAETAQAEEAVRFTVKRWMDEKALLNALDGELARKRHDHDQLQAQLKAETDVYRSRLLNMLSTHRQSMHLLEEQKETQALTRATQERAEQERSVVELQQLQQQRVSGRRQRRRAIRQWKAGRTQRLSDLAKELQVRAVALCHQYDSQLRQASQQHSLSLGQHASQHAYYTDKLMSQLASQQHTSLDESRLHFSQASAPVDMMIAHLRGTLAILLTRVDAAEQATEAAAAQHRAAERAQESSRASEAAVAERVKEAEATHAEWVAVEARCLLASDSIRTVEWEVGVLTASSQQAITERDSLASSFEAFLALLSQKRAKHEAAVAQHAQSMSESLQEMERQAAALAAIATPPSPAPAPAAAPAPAPAPAPVPAHLQQQQQQQAARSRPASPRPSAPPAATAAAALSPRKSPRMHADPALASASASAFPVAPAASSSATSPARDPLIVRELASSSSPSSYSPRTRAAPPTASPASRSAAASPSASRSSSRRASLEPAQQPQQQPQQPASARREAGGGSGGGSAASSPRAAANPARTRSPLHTDPDLTAPSVGSARSPAAAAGGGGQAVNLSASSFDLEEYHDDAFDGEGDD